MRKGHFLMIALGAANWLLLSSCDKEVKGCMDTLSYTYDPAATVDDGSCNYYYGGKEFGQIDVGSQIDLDNEYDVYIDDVYIGRSLYYFPSGLSCGNPQAVGKVVTSGNHTIKAIGNGGTEIRQGTVSLLPQSCNVVLIENLAIQSTSQNGGSNTGNVSFWLNEDVGCGNIYVSIPSYGSGTISSYYSTTPDCGENFCANFTLPYGSYTFSATSDGGCTWSGSFDVASSCQTHKLTLNGGGGGDGGGGGGSSTGSITFWTNQDLGCGNIYVNINSYGTGTINSYYTSNPGCAASGCANFSSLPFGAYYYTATSDGGCTWSGNIQVGSSCEMMQLTIGK